MTKSHLLVGMAGAIGLIAIAAIAWPKPATTPIQKSDHEPKIVVGDTTFNVTVADTAAKQVTGLGGTTHLDSHQGMYFPQDQSTNPTFWMKGMLIPIDIIWIKGDRVIGVDANAQPPLPGQQQGDLTLYSSPEDFPQAVLEIGANRAQELGIAVGDTVEFQP